MIPLNKFRKISLRKLFNRKSENSSHKFINIMMKNKSKLFVWLIKLMLITAIFAK